MSARWGKDLGQFSRSADTAKNLELTQRLLEGIQSYIVVDKSRKPSFLFIGHPDSLLAVSQSGLFSGQYPEFFRLTVIEQSTGLLDLIYQSTSSENLLLTGTEQEIEFDKSLVLLSGLDKINFEYYGWNHLHEKTDDEGNGYKQGWKSSYSGIDSMYMPSNLRLILVHSGNSIIIPVKLADDVEKWISTYYDRDY